MYLLKKACFTIDRTSIVLEILDMFASIYVCQYNLLVKITYLLFFMEQCREKKCFKLDVLIFLMVIRSL